MCINEEYISYYSDEVSRVYVAIFPENGPYAGIPGTKTVDVQVVIDVDATDQGNVGADIHLTWWDYYSLTRKNWFEGSADMPEFMRMLAWQH